MYSVFLDSVRLPVTPGKINTKIKNMNKSFTLLDGGEINLLKSPGLTEVDFEALIPLRQYPFARYDSGFKGPDYFLGLFEKLKIGKKPFQFIISRLGIKGSLFETNIRVSLEDYSFVESAENGGDFLVSIRLKQFKNVEVKKVLPLPKTETKAAVQANVSKSPRPSKTPAKSYTVKRGDTLWKICKRELGDGNKYTAIAKLNKISNPNLIYPGQVIRFE